MTNGRPKLAVSRRGASVAWASLVVVGLWPAGAAVGGAASSDDSSWIWTPQPVVIVVETDGDPSR